MNLSLRLRVAVAFALLLIVVLGGLGIILGKSISDQIVSLTRSQLLAEGRLVAGEVGKQWNQVSVQPALDPLAGYYADLFNARITFISPQGAVLGESDFDFNRMENHINRPEVIQALAGEESTQVRFSQTLQQTMMYGAIPIRVDGKIAGIARLAISMQDVQMELDGTQRTILLVTLAGIVLGIGLAILLTNRTTQPLRRLTSTVLKMSSGGEQISVSDRVDEVKQLEEAFNRLSGQLNAQITALSAEQGTLTAVLSAMADGVLIVDAAGKIQLLNAAARRIFNVPDGEGEGKALIEVVRHHQLVEL